MPQVLRSDAPAISAGRESQVAGDRVIIRGVTLGLDSLLNRELLAPARVKAFSEAFKSNAPFPHLAFEGLFAPELLELMHAEFDNLNWSDWRRFNTQYERKRGTQANTRFGPATQLYFNTIHSGEFVDFLQAVTGVDSLLPDPMLHAGGLHEIPQGGRFAMHIDFNQHPQSRLDNRLVFITYLNKDWLLSYGGALELHSVEDESVKVAIEPVFGRSALFYHSSKSLHGHPDPVNAPGGRTRRSAAAYFYTNGRADGEGSDFHTTLFPMPDPLVKNAKLADFIKYLTPPAAIDAVRWLRKTLKR
ncbi:2OG-Fe(II) oxygenase [Methylocapsa acidiphila]|uniref:2OG-Fe(II) oxygenase n=1 Tax=Methylocapsa acidiphila TaxID=133552 RepID=UPI0003FFAFB5|nr:2OG-Fe(II) oxygenase [Methylocapsa acidiphila]